VKGVFIPGLEGTAGYLIALLLWLKGYSVRGVMGVDMPSNWTALHWGLDERNATVITGLAERKVQGLLHTIIAGDRHYDGIVQLSLGLLLAKISLMYLILAQLILAKLFFASERCNGCSLCQSICPKQALRLRGRPARPYWTYACDSCMACMNCCPRQAIEVSPVVVTLFYYITSIPVVAYLMRYAADWTGLQLTALPPVGFAVQYGYIILAVAISYRLLHSVLGSRQLRAIAAMLSHTRYYRRYRAPGASWEDIHRQ
jgi:Pyruvate/2-oxoacid:ferredoxin oxidoreductase delta subunit